MRNLTRIANEYTYICDVIFKAGIYTNFHHLSKGHK